MKHKHKLKRARYSAICRSGKNTCRKGKERLDKVLECLKNSAALGLAVVEIIKFVKAFLL